MKLYTEEQVQLIIEELKKAFLPENAVCDGSYCMGCWKDVVRNTINNVYNLTPIELPSDNDIEEKFTFFPQVITGAKWMREQIKQQADGK